MPPERFSWDRIDFRKYDRSTPRWREPSSSHYGSKYDRATPRWRDSSSSHFGSARDFSRWGGPDEFRRPPGHGKQGDWHIFAEESGHGYQPFRASDRMLDDKNFRSTVARGDGRYGRNSRDRASFGQRDWRAHSWDMSAESPNTPGRLHDLSSDQRSVDDMLTYTTSHAQPEFSSTWDQLHSKEQHVNNKSDGVNGLEAGQRGDRVTSLDWKPLKWARSISLSSRGTGLSNSCSSKSLGGPDSNEGKAELPVKNVSLVTSPSREANTCVTSAISEEMSARKKQRLNWGEGLAKYEKKKVEGPEVNVYKDGAVISGSNNVVVHAQCLTVDNSPRVVGLSECGSPATPSSVACFSPGPGEKSFGNAINIDNDAFNLCDSPSTGSHRIKESFNFNLEVLDGTSLTNLLVELLQYDDSSVDSSFLRSIVMNKLLILKDNISKTLEVTESEIDSLENELESLKFESGRRCPCPVVSSSFPVEDDSKLSGVSNNIPRPSPLQVFSCGAEHVEEVLVCNNVLEEVPVCNSALEEVNCSIKDDDVDSPGTASSKFVEPVSTVKVACYPCDSMKLDEYSGETSVLHSPIVVSRSFMQCTNEEGSGVSSCGGASVSGDLSDAEDNLCNMVLAANKESATRASKVFSYMLPRDGCKIDFSEISNAALQQDDTTVRENFAWRKKLIKFNERVVTLKFKAFHHLWKEDMRLLSIRKNRAKSQKKYESGLRTTQCVIQKNRSSIRLRFSSPVGNSSLTPTTEMLNLTSKLLSESQVKLTNDLKMPALILDEKERRDSQFISRNGLVEDPWAVEKERAMINPWTSEEREIFLDKLAAFGKDFQKIASFIDHKTTADCVEFYYKNHKSDCFEKTKQRKQGKSCTNYLVASGKNRKRPLDVLGAAFSNGLEKQIVHLSGYYDSRKSCHDERETVAADILAGICGTISSDCISTVDSGKKRPSSVDEETCSDDSCGEMETGDWTDEEKSIFVQAVSSCGRDFDMISQCVRTKSRDQCKVFFSKARKCLGLDSIPTGYGNSDDADGGGSVTEDGCALETSSVHKFGSQTELHLPVSEEFGAVNKSDSKEEKTSDSCLTAPFDCGSNSKTINHEEISNESVSCEARTEDAISAGKVGSNSVREEVSYGSGDCLEGKKPVVPESCLNSRVLDSDATRTMPSDRMQPLLEDKLSADSVVQNGTDDNLQVFQAQPQILRGYPLQIPANREMMKGDISVSERKGADGFLSQDCYLQKCSNKSKVECSVPLVSQQVNGQSDCSNGDVKLFGKILSKPSSSPDGSSSVLKFDCNNNNFPVPVKSYGFWDGSKIQTGFSSIPDYFLSKYPEAFANYHGSSPPELSNASIFSSNGLVDYKSNKIERGVSDPVAALKVHYAKSGQNGNIIREGDTGASRGGDLGR